MQNLIFFGSDAYSATALNHLISTEKFNIVLIVTDHQKDLLPVETIAIAQKFNIAYYPSNPDEMSNFVILLKNLSDNEKLIGLCASFDHLVPSDIIEIFSGDLYNLHPSILPQYRNVSPVQYAIAMGESATGITLFRISTGIDNGEIISQTNEVIEATDTTSSLTPRLFQKGAELFVDAKDSDFHPHHLSTINNTKLIFTHRLKRESGYVEWSTLSKLMKSQEVLTSETENELVKLRLSHNPKGRILSDLIRALTPWPGVWSLVPTKKGDLRISLESVSPQITLKISGKANPISISDFTKYYL